MQDHILVRRDSYYDSVLLMRISRQLRDLAGIHEAVVAMATPHNLERLQATGFNAAQLSDVAGSDLVVAVRATNWELVQLEVELDGLLGGGGREGRSRMLPASLAQALEALPQAQLVVISVPGEYAAREARRALAAGRHVMIFSDNVPLQEEIQLKEKARQEGLLLMGPDCGTAILGGKPLGFANVVQRGPIGIVGASGTGIQEIASCIDRLGGGVSHAIGTGGRDLTAAVGAAMTRMAIAALAADKATAVIVLVSKPPDARVATEVVELLRQTGKPCVVHFVGAASDEQVASGNVRFVDTLAGAAEQACLSAGIEVAVLAQAPPYEEALAATLAERCGSATHLRGLFCGGTTSQEALAILQRRGLTVRCHPHPTPRGIGSRDPVKGHVVLDLGDDAFTKGRPHPMIEPTLRNDRLHAEVGSPNVALLLFDVVLGYGSHPDPAGILAEGVAEARALSRRELVAVASVTGTDGDPQGLAMQRERLERAGIVVMPDNRWAAHLVGDVLQRIEP